MPMRIASMQQAQFGSSLDNTFIFLDIEIHRGSRSSLEWMTVPLLIIGKSRNPCCFRGVQQLPTPHTNTNAWITGDLFRNWLIDFDFGQELLYCSCSGQLFCPSKRQCRPAQIRTVFLPPNITSMIQPCDIGIIRNLKANYRGKNVSRIVMHIDSSCDVTVSSLAKSITLLDTM